MAQSYELNDVDVPLKYVKSKAMPGPTLVLRVNTIGNIQAGELETTNAKADVAPLESGGAGFTALQVDGAVQSSDLMPVLGTLLESILKIGDEFAKIHPFTQVAWMALHSVYKAVQNQQETDGKIVQLVQTMAEVYAFAKDADSLSEAKKHLEGTVTTIAQQTAKCAMFIREYTGHGFLIRLATDLTSGHTKMIEYFAAVFVELQQSLDRGLRKHTAFVATHTESMTNQILRAVQDSAQSEKLQTLRPAIMNASLRLPCLAGTRSHLLSFITTWLTTPSDLADSGNILWLYGVAGAGKSTIATSISQYFSELDSLGAFLFFTRGEATSSPSSVIPTIAFGLAQSNTHVASAICAGIDGYSNVDKAPMHKQFEKLLLEPLNAAQGHIHSPIVIILDALDECGDPDSRKSLISILANDFPKLPSMFRFFVTSRPDSDIATTFLKQPKIVKRHLDITEPLSVQDIRCYIVHEMVEIRQRHSDWDLPPTWPDEKMTSLVDGAAGLFIWASTAMKLLLNTYNPNKCLDTLIHEKSSNIDSLYAVALRTTGPWEDSGFAQDAGAVLAAVVLGKVPMWASL
ncbi:hypothetical protein B0H14DRAFT_3883286 [Mycena olivaceomarginata]|nr:hypothetical protein B0H14DRAFT_3883286 [Mycena olivaceomarginata]